jgi:hypothetical protein
MASTTRPKHLRGNEDTELEMSAPAEQLPPPSEPPRMTLAGALLVPFLGLGMLHGVMAAFDALYV